VLCEYSKIQIKYKGVQKNGVSVKMCMYSAVVAQHYCLLLNCLKFRQIIHDMNASASTASPASTLYSGKKTISWAPGLSLAVNSSTFSQTNVTS